jgi:hypothetical protein
MAYNCVNGCSRVQHVSNPEVSYAGAPTGVPDYADNALALADTAPMVATWRASQVPQLPLSPTDLSASAQGHDRIDLAWSDTGLLEDGYRIERSPDGERFTLIATLAADSTGFSDSGLAAETGYFYRVSAFNGNGVAEPSNQAWATTEPAPVPAPAAPGALVAQALSDSGIALSWSDQSDDEDGFDIERSSDGGQTWSGIARLPSNTGSHTDEGLEPATYYLYRVRAFGPGGESPWSGSAGAETQAPASGCQAEGAASLHLDEKNARWTLSNTGAADLTVSRIELSWPSMQGNLRRLYLGGATIWRGNAAPGSADIASGWSGSVGDRVLAAGRNADLTLSFSRRYTGDGPDDYSVTVHFAEGCSVAY